MVGGEHVYTVAIVDEVHRNVGDITTNSNNFVVYWSTTAVSVLRVPEYVYLHTTRWELLIFMYIYADTTEQHHSGVLYVYI